MHLHDANLSLHKSCIMLFASAGFFHKSIHKMMKPFRFLLAAVIACAFVARLLILRCADELRTKLKDDL